MSLAASLLVAGLTFGSFAAAAPLTEGQQIPLWPGAAPGSETLTTEARITERSKNPYEPDRIIQGVVKPNLIAYLPAAPNGTTLIVASGGAYLREVLDKEAVEIAKLYAAKGITVFVLTYRLPGEGHANGRDVPLQDAQRAARLVRAHAREWNLDPDRIGFLGFSAAGHMASMLGAKFAAPVYAPVDDADKLSARPDFLMLLYPVVSMEDGITHPDTRTALLGATPDKAAIEAYSSDLHVTKDTPPTLLILADDDQDVPPENAIRYYRALKRAGVPAELHVFAQGKHGFSVKFTKGLPVAVWPETGLAWIKAIKMVP
ncbi:alpha/beta hydrolase [Siculibacillus lacustris]|uniref:Alpha/beta hydrolase n=1 Tax=Siculibacillus lacustris TaxID=1549641 RepID=A0A4Q9VCS8_9HYPH|nr:alpha/beta hydrolase [Siculibacillus lacustris]